MTEGECRLSRDTYPSCRPTCAEIDKLAETVSAAAMRVAHVKTYAALRVPAAALRGSVIAVARTLAVLSRCLRSLRMMNAPGDDPHNDKGLLSAASTTATYINMRKESLTENGDRS